MDISVVTSTREALDGVSPSLPETEVPQMAPLSSFLSCGCKHDTLIHIRDLLGGKVPLFFGFTDAQVRPFLSLETRALWAKVSEMGSAALEEDHLIGDLEVSVERDILAAELPLTPEQIALLKEWEGKTLIVRSSSNEDSKESINAGGNKSLGGTAPTPEAIKKVLAKVIASYFTHDSLRNRSAFGNPFREMPLCSALIMEQIVDQEAHSPIVSGVMMTHKTDWIPRSEGQIPYIAASWGFGGGVTSGKVPCDEWILTESGAYATIRQKRDRLKTLPGGKVARVANPLELREVPVLSEKQLDQLREIAVKLEGHFKQPMNVEFVFQGDQLYIVQGRSIQTPEISSPTFLDPAQIPPHSLQFHCTTVIPGTSEVLSIPGNQVLFAEDLEAADRAYNPIIHRAVVVRNEPEGANSHPEVNFSSQKRPVPCLVLSEDAYDHCRKIVKETQVQICPQTGLILISNGAAPMIRNGLFLHPANFSITVDPTYRRQRKKSTHKMTQHLQELLRAVPEILEARLDEIERAYREIAREISERPAMTDRLKRISGQIDQVAMQIFKGMKKAPPTTLSFHATLLRHLVEESLTSLEAETHLSQAIESFILEHRDNQVLCELALLGNKAYDVSLQEKWLTFLAGGGDTSGLLEKLRQFDALGILSLWFAIHFTDTSSIIDEGSPEFYAACFEFGDRFRQLTENTERIATLEELQTNWEMVVSESQAFLRFCSQNPERDLLQSMQLSKVYYDLVQLWDLNIKSVRTSRFLPTKQEATCVKERLKAFAQFARDSVKCSAIHLNEIQHKELEDVIIYSLSHGGFQSRWVFSVQHWLIPLPSHRPTIKTDDEALTVLHQNLLQLSSPPAADVTRFLPGPLALTVESFQKNRSDLGRRSATFVSMSDEKATVTMNVPLNLHSFVVTLQQTRGSEELTISAYWRGSDNPQVAHLEFIKVFSALSGISIKSYSIHNTSLKVVFSIRGCEQIDLLTKAIFHVNRLTLSRSDYLEALIELVHPEQIVAESESAEWDQETKETKMRIFDYMWNQFVATEQEMPWWFKNIFKKSGYLTERGLLPQVICRVKEELQGIRLSSGYEKMFTGIVLRTMSVEELNEVQWLNIIGPQTLSCDYLEDGYRNGLFKRLCQEAPLKAVSFCEKNYLRSKFISEFQSIAREMAASKEPKTADQLVFIAKFT